MLDVCRAKSLSRLLTHQGCTLVLYLVMSSLPTRLILYGLHYSYFSLSERFFDEDDVADDDYKDGQETDRRTDGEKGSGREKGYRGKRRETMTAPSPI